MTTSDFLPTAAIDEMDFELDKQPTPEKLMHLGLGFWGSKTLLSAIEFGLFTVLAKGPQNLNDLTESLKLHPRSSRDFFDTLVALGVLERKVENYANTPESDLFLDRAKPTYIGGMLEMANNRLYKFWGSLTEGLLTGKPQNEILSGEPGLFEAIYKDPVLLKEFLKGMTGLSMAANLMAAKNFPWKNYKTFIDIGGAQGGLAVQVALANTHISGGEFDLPVVKPVFEDYVDSFNLGDRLRFHTGDFFKDPLPKADVLTMGNILHDWNMEEKKMLIRKAFEALPDGGALIVIESIIDDDRSKNSVGLLMSLNMLIETPGGFNFTGTDCCAWLKEAGFREARCEHLIGPDSMVIGIK